MEGKVLPARKGGLTGNALKIIAVAAMTIDHVVWTISPGQPGYNYAWWAILLHIVGRVTAPIMWFMIAEGYYHTRNLNTYAKRLLVFALVSHFAYRFCFGYPFYPTGIFDQTGIGWPLFWGLQLLTAWKKETWKSWQKWLFLLFVFVITLPSDWSAAPALAILMIGLNRGSFRKQMLWMQLFASIYAIGYMVTTDLVYGMIQLGVCLSIPLLALYNGERGKGRYIGRVMYWIYPGQLFLLGLLRFLIK